MQIIQSVTLHEYDLTFICYEIENISNKQKYLVIFGYIYQILWVESFACASPISSEFASEHICVHVTGVSPNSDNVIFFNNIVHMVKTIENAFSAKLLSLNSP